MTADVKEQGRELTLVDRCDSCGAAAKVIATFLNGELMFCGHHARNLEKHLKTKAVNVYDPEGVTNALNQRKHFSGEMQLLYYVKSQLYLF